MILVAQVKPTTSDLVCHLIARQVVAYLRFFDSGKSEGCAEKRCMSTHEADGKPSVFGLYSVRTDPVRHFIHEQVHLVPRTCIAWWGRPYEFVEEALVRCQLNSSVSFHANGLVDSQDLMMLTLPMLWNRHEIRSSRV